MAGGSLGALAAFAVALADEARAMLVAAAATRPALEVKPDRSFVTDLDRAVELRLRELITDRFPAHGVIGEEGGPPVVGELTWVLDPIDGTAAFIAGMPVYGTLIALLDGATPVIGVIDLPSTSDRWIGIAGQATRHATRHGADPCATRRCPALAEAILSASNPDFFSDAERPALAAMQAATAWRIYGGACRAYGLLASGRTDLAIDTRLQLWDYAPFVPIIEGAGGIITDWQGRRLTMTSGPQILAAGDPARQREALVLVEKALSS